MGTWRLVADVGGTNVRFARALEDGRLADRAEHATADWPHFADALAAFLDEVGGARECASASLAAAGPVRDGEVRLTNGDWVIRRDEVARLLGGVPVRLFNDLQAAALAIPWLDAADLWPVVVPKTASAQRAVRLAVNVGTGFGAAALVPVEDGWASLASEAGHMTLGAATADELALRRELEPPALSVEDVLSGAGLVRLYRHVAGSGTASGDLHSAEVLARAATDPAARRTIAVFNVLLGRVAGDLVLATGAWGGVYLFGSVLLGWYERADREVFRQSFTAKGKMTARMSEVPVHVAANEAAPLIGLARHGEPGTLPA